MNISNFSVEDIHTKKINYKTGVYETSRFIDIKKCTFVARFAKTNELYTVFSDRWLVRKIKMGKL